MTKTKQTGKTDLLRIYPMRIVVLLAIICGAQFARAQLPPMRRHTANTAKPLRLVPATERPPGTTGLTINQERGVRVIRSNGIPDHAVGRFPNRGNPNRIRTQRYELHLPIDPQPAKEITPIHLTDRWGPPSMPFGVAVNGVLFDPGTAEYWQGDRNADWNYEALGGAVSLGIDQNHAHVQPSGAYHYHGIPTLLLERHDFGAEKHSPQVGWAADGFPIYALYGFIDPNGTDSKVVELKSSYRLKDGNRPGGSHGPGGAYDGTFIQDYEFVAGSGDLDQCNGRYCKTPEFLDDTYAYFLTNDWPVIPRAFRGEPVNLRNGRRP